MSDNGQSYSRDLELSNLVEAIDKGFVGLPNFQRDFDWNESDISSLLATVLSGWPAGSLLMMIGRPSFFNLRPFEEAPPLSSPIQFVVLDGQQRLTSLFHALKGRGRKVWCLEVERALTREVDAELIEDALVAIDRKRFERPEFQTRVARGELIPLHVASSAADFYEWRDELAEALDPLEATEVSRKLSRLYRAVLSNAHTYKFPAMMLDNNLEAPAIARIFERINKTGMRLSVFDLLVARSYSEEWSLRDEWLDAQTEYPILERFLGEDGLAIIQALALSRVRDVRRPALLRLESKMIKRDWPRFLAGTVRACEFLADRGCHSGDWMPYATQLLPLAAIASDSDLWEGSEAETVLDQWLWSSSFTRAYDVASSTVAADDYERLSAVLRGKAELPQATILAEDLLTNTRQNGGALWRSFRLFLAANGALDLLTAAPLDALSGGDLVMHPLLIRGGLDPAIGVSHLSTLSLALVTKESASKLRRRPYGLRKKDDLEAVAVRSQLLDEEVPPVDRILDPRGLIEDRFDTLVARLNQRHPSAFRVLRSHDV